MLKKSLSIAALSLLIININATEASQQPCYSLSEQYQQTVNKKFNSKDNIDAFDTYLATRPDNTLAELYTAGYYYLVVRDTSDMEQTYILLTATMMKHSIFV